MSIRRLMAAALVLPIMGVAAPAVAKPPVKAGTPTNLTLSVTHPDENFAVAGTWGAATNATRYAVSLTNQAGTVLASASVTATSWTAATNAPDGSSVTMHVTAYNGTRKGGTASNSVLLPDVTAPTAAYAVSHVPERVGADVTVTSSQLSDNLTPVGSIVQTIDWGDGTAPQAWNPLTPSINHVYPDQERRYEAFVTLKDQAQNTRTYPLVIVVNDVASPIGTFAVGSTYAWAQWTKVALSESGVADNLTPGSKVTRVVSWGDGQQDSWTGSGAPTHVYAAAGTYQPTVTLTDEAGNASPALPAQSVVVRADTGNPTVKLTPPSRRKAAVRSWRTLKGTAADAETGVRNVTVVAIQKRATGWFAYRATANKWVKAASKGKAWGKAVAASVPTAGPWSVRLVALRKGKLLYKARAFDNVGNASALASKRAILTK